MTLRPGPLDPPPGAARPRSVMRARSTPPPWAALRNSPRSQRVLTEDVFSAERTDTRRAQASWTVRTGRCTGS
jgi:hypothetical protein